MSRGLRNLSLLIVLLSRSRFRFTKKNAVQLSYISSQEGANLVKIIASIQSDDFYLMQPFLDTHFKSQLPPSKVLRGKIITSR